MNEDALDVVWFMLCVAGALFYAEWQTRTVATTRYFILTTFWFISGAMLVWLAFGAPPIRLLAGP